MSRYKRNHRATETYEPAIAELMNRFDNISKKAERFNARKRVRRFFIMSHIRGEKTIDVGIYDGKTKKYALTSIRAHNAKLVLSEMEELLNKAGA